MTRIAAARAARLSARRAAGLLALFAILPGVAPLTAQQPPTAAATPVLFRAVRVFDGERVLERRDVLVRDGRIAAVGERLTPPRGAEVVDGGGRTLLPGLIDAHVHAFGDALRQALVFGVTTELDMFTDHRFAAAMRAEQAAGGGLGRADLYSAGTLVTAPGGHGTQFGMPIPTLTHPDSAAGFVDARLAEGSDWIKIVLEDASSYGRRIPSVDSATMHAAVEAAHRRGRLAVVHVSRLADARAALAAGADGLVHLFVDTPPDDAFVREAARRGVFVVPTLTVLQSAVGTPGGASLVDDARLRPHLDAAGRAMLAQAFPRNPAAPPTSYGHAVETVRRLKAAGVPVLAGTDAANPGTAHGASMHGELALLVDAGLTPLEALASATSVPARAFRLADRGRIAPGLRADLVLVEGDPTRDVTATRAIVGVWKAGVALDRDAHARAVAAADSAAASATRPVATGDGLVSDFEEGRPAVTFGQPWVVTTDAMAGGKSEAAMEVVQGGADGSVHALAVRGTVAPGLPFAWAGVMFMPGPQPMAPVDLSAHREVRLWARGDGRTYQVLLFLQGRGMTPVARTFVAGPEWQEHAFPFADFQTDGRDVMGIAVVAGPDAGPFALQVDRVRLR